MSARRPFRLLHCLFELPGIDDVVACSGGASKRDDRSNPFAHTAPLWFGSASSMDPAAASRAARELLSALDVAEARIRQSYAGTETPVLLGRIAMARQKLQSLAR